MSESDEVATAVKAAFLVIFHTVRGSKESFFNEQLEVAELKYQHALRRLKTEYPEQFCGFGARSYKAIFATRRASACLSLGRSPFAGANCMVRV